MQLARTTISTAVALMATTALAGCGSSITNETAPTPSATVSPSTTPPAPPATARASTTPTPDTFGPTGFHGIDLGMTLAQVQALGTKMVPESHWAGCEDGVATGAWVTVADKAGVAMITLYDRSATTPEGIRLGSAKADVLAAYPDAKAGPDHWEASVPGNPSAHYWFAFADGRVSKWKLETGPNCSFDRGADGSWP